MPTYDYVCKACEKPFEELVFGDEKIACPHCDSKRVERQVSSFSLGAQSGPGGIPSSVLEAARVSSGGNVPPQLDGSCGSCGSPDGPGSCD